MSGHDSPIDVLFASNRYYAPLLLVAVKSLLTHASDSTRLRITILNRELPESLQYKIESYCKNADCSLQFVSMEEKSLRSLYPLIPSSYFELPESGHYDRLLAPYLIPSSRVLYLDCDIYIQEDLECLWNENLNSYAIGAIQDQIIPTIGDDCGIVDWKDRGLDPEIPYFNSGVLLVDLQRWREEDLSRRCCDCAVEFTTLHGVPPPLCDQYAYNVIFLNQWRKLERRWNSFASKIRAGSEGSAIVHFAGAGKPILEASRLSGPEKYFAREATGMIKDDWDDILRSEEKLARHRRYHEYQEKLRQKLTSPNGNAVTFAPPSQLSQEADQGEIAMVIPVLVKEADSLRFRNLLFLLEYYSQHVAHLILSEQLVAEQSSLDAWIKETKRSSVHHLRQRFETDSIHKCALINYAADFAFKELGVRYVWQIDADILVNPKAILQQLSALNSKLIPVVRPLLHFIRLTAETSEEVLQLDCAELASLDPSKEHVSPYRVIDLFGPGSVIFSREAFENTGGMDESFTGWGWEDMDFAKRLSEFSTPHTLPMTGCHLHHEEDRVPCFENYRRFCERHHPEKSDDEIRHILVHTIFHNFLRKFCILSFLPEKPIDDLSERIRNCSDALYLDGPIDKSRLPASKHFASGLPERITYSLSSEDKRTAGFYWELADSWMDPIERRPIETQELLDFLVSSHFQILLITPDAGGGEENPSLSLHTSLTILERSCEFYDISFESIILQTTPSEIEQEKAMDRILDHLIPDEHSHQKKASPILEN